MPSGPARPSVCLVFLRAGSLAAAVLRASKTMLARGIGGKVFAESKARYKNFVQAVQKKRLQRLNAVSALCVLININIYAPFSGLVGTAQKFGFAGLTARRPSVYHSSRRQGNSPGGNHDERQVTP